MKRLQLLIIILFAFALTSSAQTRKPARKKASISTTAKKKRQTSTKKKTKTNTADYETASIKGLKNERAQIKKQIAAHQQKLRKNERDVKERLKNLMVINSEIADKRRTIDTIRRDITHLDGNITKLNSQLDVLGKELNDRKQKYVKSMRYMHRNRSIQSQLMFIFSAKNFSQMYRRMRFMREYASYQRAQGAGLIRRKGLNARPAPHPVGGSVPFSIQVPVLHQAPAQQKIIVEGMPFADKSIYLPLGIDMAFAEFTGKICRYHAFFCLFSGPYGNPPFFIQKSLDLLLQCLPPLFPASVPQNAKKKKRGSKAPA